MCRKKKVEVINEIRRLVLPKPLDINVFMSRTSVAVEICPLLRSTCLPLRATAVGQRSSATTHCYEMLRFGATKNAVRMTV